MQAATLRLKTGSPPARMSRARKRRQPGAVGRDRMAPVRPRRRANGTSRHLYLYARFATTPAVLEIVNALALARLDRPARCKQ